jgi:hypothetical protein
MSGEAVSLGVPVALLSTWLTCDAGVIAALTLLICDRLAAAASSAVAAIPSSDVLSFTTVLLTLSYTYKRCRIDDAYFGNYVLHPYRSDIMDASSACLGFRHERKKSLWLSDSSSAC